MSILYGYSFLHAFDRRPYAVHEQVKIIQDFLEVYIYIERTIEKPSCCC